MWNDGPAKQPWLNYFNEYELQHCCFGGDGEDGNGGGTDNTISSREEEDKALGQVSEENAAAAAAAAAAASAAAETTGVGVEEGTAPGYEDPSVGQFDISVGPDPSGPNESGDFSLGDSVKGIDSEGNISFGTESGYDPEQDFYSVIDPDTGTASVKDATGKDVTDEVGYNDLVDAGFFDAVDKGISDFDKGVARDIQEDLRSRPGLEDEVVSINPVTGDFEYSSFAGGLAGTGQGLVDLYSEFGPGAIAMDAARGFYDMVTGLPGAVADISTDLRNEVADIFGVSPSEVTQEQVNAVTSGVGPDAGIGEFSPSAAQVAASRGVSPNERGYGDAALSVVETRGGPAIDMTDAQLAVGYDTAYEDYSKAMAEAQAAAQKDKDKQEMEDELGFSRPNERSPSGFGDVAGYSSPAVGGGIDYASQVAADRDRAALSADVLDAIAREKSDRAKTTSPFDDEYTMTGRPKGPEEYTMTGRPKGPEEYTMSPGPASPGYGGAALDVGFMTDEALREGYTQEARDFANLDYTPTIGPFEEIQGDDPIILPKKKEEEEEKPKSAMAQYFERLGVPSPYAPSTTQSTSPYLSAVASQPAGAPEDLFARMARIRREEALKTPRFNYAGFAPFSPNLYAAAYGISPEEARERIPALPTLKQTIGLPDEDEDETTEAYGGGGLNTLMRTR